MTATAPRAERLATLAAIALVAIALVRITDTYRRFSQTYDEPAHLIMGLEWLDRGTYTLEVQHPPLARVVVALVPWLSGVRYPPKSYAMTNGSVPFAAGNDVLLEGDEYARRLTLARIGTLAFLILGAFVVWSWTRRLAGPPAAAIAVGLFTLLPPILAHASLATTDMALAAMMPAALYAFARWREEPRLRTAIVFAITFGCAIATKFSAIPFLGLAMGIVLLCGGGRFGRLPSNEGGRSARRHTWVIVVVALLVVWAWYRFDVWPVRLYGYDPADVVASIARYRGVADRVLHAILAAGHAPAPQFFAGLAHVVRHNAQGHASYLLGRIYPHGVWFYFPVVLALKTPLAFGILAIVGVAITLRSAWNERRLDLAIPAIGAVSIVVVAMTSSINIGVRHVLPVYPLLAICAAVGIERMLLPKALLAALGMWLVIAGALAHPDYLASTNELALLAPQPPLVDSDLDWGQDLPRLRDAVARHHIGAISIAYFGSISPVDYGIGAPARPLPPRTPTEGWIAISRTRMSGVYDGGADAFAWLARERPVEEIGKSMLLYRVTRSSGASP